jgi:hypothetical protein
VKKEGSSARLDELDFYDFGLGKNGMIDNDQSFFIIIFYKMTFQQGIPMVQSDFV